MPFVRVLVVRRNISRFKAKFAIGFVSVQITVLPTLSLQISHKYPLTCFLKSGRSASHAQINHTYQTITPRTPRLFVLQCPSQLASSNRLDLPVSHVTPQNQPSLSKCPPPCICKYPQINLTYLTVFPSPLYSITPIFLFLLSCVP